MKECKHVYSFIVADDRKTSKEIMRLIQSVNKCYYYVLQKHFKARCKMKCNIYKTLIKFARTYDCGT